jgi:hypothetical protein
MRLPCLLLAACLISPLTWAGQSDGIGYPTVAAALGALKARADVTVSDQGGWIIFEDKSSSTFWSFTPPQHPAHPAAVKRTIVSRNGAIALDMKALCQADKGPCDTLIAEFTALNEEMAKQMQAGASTVQRLPPSDIQVETLSAGAYRLILKSYRSTGVEAGQQELLGKAQELCKPGSAAFGKYQFETKEPLSASASSQRLLVLRQEIACTAAMTGAAAPAAQDKPGPSFQASALQIERVTRQSTLYFAAKDGQRYGQAYAQLSPIQKEALPYERFTSLAISFNASSGAVEQRAIKKLSWYVNPPQVAPGVYVAVDVVSRFANIPLHCGFIAWQEQADGSFLLVREEQNYIDAATFANMKTEDIDKARVQFTCRQ